MAFLEEKSNKSKEEIRKLPYPEFKELIAYYGDPKEWLKPRKLTNEEAETELERLKSRKQRLYKKLKK